MASVRKVIYLVTALLFRLAASEAVVEINGEPIDHKGIQYPDKHEPKTNLTCFGDKHLGQIRCYGVNHARFDDGIKKFCGIADGFTVSSMNQKRALFMQFDYPANVDHPGACNKPDYAKGHQDKCTWTEVIMELGQIHIQIHRDEKYGSSGPKKITKDSCTQSLMAIVDMCDTDAVDGKKGGQLMPRGNWGNDDLTYTINPNPNWVTLCHNVPDLGPDGNNGTDVLQIPSGCGDGCRIKMEVGQEVIIEGAPSKSGSGRWMV